MIRFCDRAIGSVEYDSLSMKELQEYFLSGHEDEVLCVYDDFNTMGYIGVITYYSLQSSININSAICEEYVVLGLDMWQDAREHFTHWNGSLGSKFLLPVFDQECHLICFAYEDMDANREIRMIRELTETPETLQFPDVYPNYNGVKIYGFNELAYFFAKYLESQNIVVQVEGMMWQGFFDGEECQMPDYECLVIYAEGIDEKKRNWRENLLKSVSVEFECIDKIYETNIKEGRIRNAEGDCSNLIERLKNENEIIILRVGCKEQDAYNFLLGNGIDICCFVSMNPEDQGRMILGKPVLSELEAWHRYQDPVFIDCLDRNSAWGLGSIDYYDYLGYRRNKKYIQLRDYIEVSNDSLLNILRNAKVALLGDVYLCSRLYDYLKRQGIPVKGYVRMLSGDTMLQKLPEIRIEDTDETTLWLLVEPVYYLFDFEKEEPTSEEKRKRLIEYVKKNRINNYTDYFSNMASFISIEASEREKYTKSCLMPKRIVVGAIESANGNVFFRGLLDNHPSVVLMHHSKLNNNLFWICVCLSMVKADEVLPLLWKMIEGSERSIFNPAAFNEKMTELLSYGNKFTSSDLFVMIHIAYMHMCGRNMEEDGIRNMVIYWEPHFIDRSIMEECTTWLGTEEIPCDIINIVRNMCMQRGHGVKMAMSGSGVCIYDIVLGFPVIEKKNYTQGGRMVVKFEDLKCRPREILEIICNKWDIPWSDALMATTRCGKEESMFGIKNFDLGPVYNTYENYFSEYDRLRMMLISAPWQRKYGYPYVKLAQFSRRELQEMFSDGFRFEELIDSELCGNELDDKLDLQSKIRYRLQKTRMLEFYHDL